MEDGIGVLWALFQQRDRIDGRQRQQLDTAPLSFPPQLWGERESPLCPGPDHETTAVPRDVLRERQGRVAVRRAERPGRLLVPLSYDAPVEHHVVVVGLAVDLDRAERETLEAHRL